MAIPRKLNEESVRRATLEFLCGLDVNAIARRCEVKTGTLRHLVVSKYSRELGDALIEFYRGTNPHNKERNAIHMYLSFAGLDVPKKELVLEGGSVVNYVGIDVFKQIICSRYESVVHGMEAFFEPSNGYELLFDEVFLKGSRTDKIVPQIFRDVLLKEYQGSEVIDLSKVADISKAKLVEAIKQGGLIITPKKKRLVHDVLATLDPQERDVFILRYGLGAEEVGHTQVEIGRKFDLSKERVSQVLNRGLRKLRHPNRTRIFDLMTYLTDEKIDEYNTRVAYEKEEAIWRERLYPKFKAELGGKVISGDTDVLSLSVNEIEFSMRTANTLNNAEIATIEQLVSKTEQEMLKYRNFGRKSLQEIKDQLQKFGLTLGMKLRS